MATSGPPWFASPESAKDLTPPVLEEAKDDPLFSEEPAGYPHETGGSTWRAQDVARHTTIGSQPSRPLLSRAVGPFRSAVGADGDDAARNAQPSVLGPLIALLARHEGGVLVGTTLLIGVSIVSLAVGGEARTSSTLASQALVVVCMPAFSLRYLRWITSTMNPTVPTVDVTLRWPSVLIASSLLIDVTYLRPESAIDDLFRAAAVFAILGLLAVAYHGRPQKLATRRMLHASGYAILIVAASNLAAAGLYAASDQLTRCVLAALLAAAELIIAAGVIESLNKYDEGSRHTILRDQPRSDPPTTKHPPGSAQAA